ncbi:hypothetical protein VNO77_34039 [Canavalia gladiata]|uniref:Isoliquiritigenin 2'-O-methyltransferase n=1 Tax=Canavalia gladiata TaxID=3824 RepID=A0AAN9KGW2_CANGL
MSTICTEDQLGRISRNQTSKNEACRSALILCMNQVFTAVLNGAVELNLFDIIAKETTRGSLMSASDITSKMPTQHSELPNRLERMLRMLASYSLLTCATRSNSDGSIERVYGVSPVGKYFVPDESRGNFASFIATSVHYIFGIEHVGGDMYKSVPHGDAMILRGVLHNWSNEKCLSLLRNCHKALPQNGKVIVVDYIVAEASDSDASKIVSMMDNLMLINHGSRERPTDEFETLSKLSGFSRFELVCNTFIGKGIMEFHK